MRCPKCGHEENEEHRFCSNCCFEFKPEKKEGDLLALHSTVTTIDKVVLEGQGTKVDECPICGKMNLPNEVFRCKRCQRPHICLSHRCPDTYLCEECQRKQEAEDHRQGEEHPVPADETQPQPRPDSKEKKHPPAGSLRQKNQHLWLRLDGESEMEFVRIPPGEFLMGSAENDPHARLEEKPQHSVRLPEFWMGRWPVTNRQYQAFVRAKRKSPPALWSSGRIPLGKELHPVVKVSWKDAVEFCNWLDELVQSTAGVGQDPPIHKPSLRIRLPSEAEWEKAARGSDGRIYPWGNQRPGKMLCNFSSDDTLPVNQFSPLGDSPWNCADMSGNTWEWTSTLFRPYPYRATDGRESPQSQGQRVLRGGAYYNDDQLVRCAFRFNLDPAYSKPSIGFRVCALPTSNSH